MGNFKEDTNTDLENLFRYVNDLQQQITKLAKFVDSSTESAEVTSNRMNIVNTSLNKVEDQVDHFRKFLAESPVYNEALVNHTLNEIKHNSQNADTILAQRITKLEAFTFEPVEVSITTDSKPKRHDMSDFEKNVLNDIHALQIDQRVNKKRSDIDATRINSVADQLNGLHRSIKNTIDALDDRITTVGSSLANDITEVGGRGYQDQSTINAFRSRLETVEDSIDEHFPSTYRRLDEIEDKADSACLDVASVNVHERMQDSWIRDLSVRIDKLEDVTVPNNINLLDNGIENLKIRVSAIEEKVPTIAAPILSKEVYEDPPHHPLGMDDCFDEIFKRVSLLELHLPQQARDEVAPPTEVYSDHLHPYVHRLAYSLSNGDRMAYDAAYHTLMKLDNDEAKQLMRLCKITFESFPERFITE